MRCLLLIALSLTLVSTVSSAEQNLLFNGGFEGSLSYWIPRGTPVELVQADDAKQGHWFLRATGKGFVHSTPMVLEVGKTYTFGAWVRSAQGGKLNMTVHPTPRQAGMPPFAIGRGGAGAVNNYVKEVHQVTLSSEWQRVYYTVTLPDFGNKEKHNFPSPWFWDSKSWWLFFEGPSGGYDIDGISIVEGDKDSGWLPASAVELAVDITNLPGYEGTANLFERGATLQGQTAIHNPSTEPIKATLRWDLVDYQQAKVFATQEEDIEIPAGATLLKQHEQVLNANGTLLLRATLTLADERVVSSYAPATVLPFPKAATTIDPAERFGGTYVAGQPPADHFMTTIAQHIGLRWTRWYPHVNWSSVQPDGPETWNFPDDIVEAQKQHGIAVNIVLYSLPKWAIGKHQNLPKDMEDWQENDPRWQDLSIETSWDRFVKTSLKHYPGPGFVWEVVNEPQFGKWDHGIYYRFIERTYRTIKAIDPAAKVMVNSVNGFDGISQDFARRGGASIIDVFTYHNYGSGGYASAESVENMRRAFTRPDGTAPEIWFNEGWTWTPSSRAAVSPGMRSDRPPAVVAHTFVRTHAETFTAGQDKMIYFNMTYPNHGRSWWDYAGDGTAIWDDHNEPTVAVPVLNVLIDQIGLSKSLAAIRHQHAWIHVFDDQRHQRGVAIIWGTEAAGVDLRLPLGGLQAMDIMGNPETVDAEADATVLHLQEADRPIYVFADGISGETLALALQSLQMPAMSTEDGVYSVPRDWMERGEAGNPYLFNEKPLWTIARLLPAKFDDADAFIPLRQWLSDKAMWRDTEASQGGQPGGKIDKEGNLQLGVRAAWGGNQGNKPAGIIFHAPEEGTYTMTGVLNMNRWEGKSAGHVALFLLNSEQGDVQELARWNLEQNKDLEVSQAGIELRSGQRVALMAFFDGMYTGGTFTFKNLQFATKK